MHFINVSEQRNLHGRSERILLQLPARVDGNQLRNQSASLSCGFTERHLPPAVPFVLRDRAAENCATDFRPTDPVVSDWDSGKAKVLDASTP